MHARELLEVSLAHLTGGQTEIAYWSGDVIERRRALMEDWATYATTVDPVAISLVSVLLSGTTWSRHRFDLGFRFPLTHPFGRGTRSA